MADDFFKIDLADGSTLSFNNIAEIEAWLSHETKAFDWLNKGGRQAGNQVSVFRDGFFARFTELRGHLSTWRNSPDDVNAQNLFRSSMQKGFKNKIILRSDDPIALIATDIATRENPVAASAAFGVLFGLPSDSSVETVKGITAAILRRDGITPHSPEIIARQVTEINKAANEAQVQQKAEWHALRQNADSQLEGAKSTLETTVGDFASRADAMIAGLTESANTVIKKIEATEASYKAQMQLQAPVEYWSTKAESHREAINGSRLRLIWFAILGSSALVLALLWLATNAVAYAENAKGDTAIYLKFAAIGAIVTTIIFWIGRVLLRIYLSDRHLLTDAEERVAMIKTYLAFSNDGKVEAVDRALILGPIFKSASDGIVRDDGPDTSLGGVLAKLIDVRNPR